MSLRVVDRSPDLQRLHNDCYDLSITPGSLLVIDRVPYVTPSRRVAYGRLVSSIELAGERTVNPIGDHSLYFEGETPCDQHGAPLQRVIIEERTFDIEPGLTVTHRFSCKPADTTPYADNYEKMTAYVDILMSHARSLDPTVKATREHPVVLADDDPDAPFVYRDVASARAAIGAISDKLKLGRVAIVGLGGTGSYILDLISKTPIGEIHLYDGDDFVDHNAFRAPGAASLETLHRQPKKVEYYAAEYARIKNRIIPHPYDISESTVDELRAMDFVFLSAEGGRVKRLVVDTLEAASIPFIDAGLSVTRSGDQLGGVVCVALGATGTYDFARGKIDLSVADNDDIYDNVQIADLNALNAALAVIRWKRYFAFYRDFRPEWFSAFTVDVNQLASVDGA